MNETPDKPVVWLLLARLDDPQVPLVLPTMSWMAADAGVLCECYLEAARSGELFAPSGSLVCSGQHHQAWNWLHARAHVRYIVLGRTQLFASSLGMGEVLAAGDAAAIYATLMAEPGVRPPSGAALLPLAPIETADGDFDVATYLHPDICLGRRLAVADPSAAGGIADRSAFFTEAPAGWKQADLTLASDTPATITARIAERWQGTAAGVAFGDPLAIRAQLAWHCRTRRVSLWGVKRRLPAPAVRVSAYVEERSSACDAAGELAAACDPPLIIGRQTGDGDILAWSARGVGMEITDPCRPPLPVVEAMPQTWARHPVPEQPDDAQLERWADEGRQLACVLIHSGEIAHNEAMLALCELAGRHGVALGLAACVGRYRTCPQQWEMIAAARGSGGFAGLVEPLLYGNGWGVMAECVAPPDRLRSALQSALAAIRAIAGEAGTPRGHYSFLDTDLETLSLPAAELHRAYVDAGLAFDISCGKPGRNRLLHRQDGFVALNQTCRCIHSASPYVRIQDPEDLGTATGTRPGWLLATLDAPVVAFAPAVWDRGTRISELFRRVAGGGRIAATPSTIARYARLLAGRGELPVDREGSPCTR